MASHTNVEAYKKTPIENIKNVSLQEKKEKELGSWIQKLMPFNCELNLC